MPNTSLVSELLQGIVAVLLRRAKEGHLITLMKVKSHIGCQGHKQEVEKQEIAENVITR